jgi:hypothetical protein
VRQLRVQRVRVDLPCSSGRMPPPLPGWREAKRDGAEQLALRAACGQLDADAREVLDHTRTDLDKTLAEGIELSLCERVRLRNGVAHVKHQPKRCSVKDEPHLIGRCTMTRHAVRRHLCLVKFNQVLQRIR